MALNGVDLNLLVALDALLTQRNVTRALEHVGGHHCTAHGCSSRRSRRGQRQVPFAAQQLSFSEMVDSIEDITGHRYRRRWLGSVDDLRARVRARLNAGRAPRDVVRDVHALYMLSGQTALRDLRIHPHPQVPLEQVDTVVRRTLAPSATR